MSDDSNAADRPHPPPDRRLSDRARKVLLAVSRLPVPEQEGGWRRATYRDQLHESVPGLSRGALSRCLASGELAGLVEVEGVGRSARLPEGYRLTAEGRAELDRSAGSIQPDPARSSPPIQSVGSGLSSSLPKTKRKQEPTTERTDPAPIHVERSSGPIQFDGPFVLDLAPATRNALLAGLLGVPLCDCADDPRPLVEREQGKSGRWFLGCLRGKKGCGVTLPLMERRGQPPRRESPPQPSGPPKRDLSTLSLQELVAEKRAREAGGRAG